MHALVRNKEDETLDGYLKSILKRNEIYLKNINPGVDLNELYDELFKPILDDEIGGDMLTNLGLLTDGSLLEERFIVNHPSLVLFAYCNQAMEAQEKGLIDDAWKYLIEASYWLGMASVTSMMPMFQESFVKEARSEHARKGGVARGKQYEIIKEEVFRLVHEKKPKNGWNSRRQASLKILNDVIEFSKKINLPLSADQAQKTISEWLGPLKDKEGLFK